MLCTAGEFMVATREGERSISRGQSLFITAAELPATATFAGHQCPGQLFATSARGYRLVLPALHLHGIQGLKPKLRAMNLQKVHSSQF